jgi:hypothetical protein
MITINLTLSKVLIYGERQIAQSHVHIYVSVTTEGEIKLSFAKFWYLLAAPVATSDPTPQLGQTSILKPNAMRKSKRTDTT